MEQSQFYKTGKLDRRKVGSKRYSTFCALGDKLLQLDGLSNILGPVIVGVSRGLPFEPQSSFQLITDERFSSKTLISLIGHAIGALDDACSAKGFPFYGLLLATYEPKEHSDFKSFLP